MSSLHIRLFQKADFVFADSLRALAGWNQTPDDWMRFLNHQPDGCFVAEWDGQPVGTATTTIYEDKVAWIGMVLVHPDARRRGIGRSLLEHCIAFLKPRVACIKLDATPLGKTLYDTMGFKDEWTLRRWETARVELPANPMKYRVRRWRDVDVATLQALDAEAFGAVRWQMVQRMTWIGARALVHLTPKQRVNAFGILRRGARAHYLGPVVADSIAAAGPLIKSFLTELANQPVYWSRADEAAALAQSELLAHSILKELPNQPIFWDIPDANTCAVELAQRLGFQPQRTLIRMFLGENNWPGDPQKIFALAGPEIG
ncbi:MAG: GNAT family N-acetyltransferase [Verrucomicrobia bacterium]|nr:GNAT family N-acetyltransferase [Verrucomicrobiota bacterium]